MNLITPEGGLLFWMMLIFGIVFFILAKWGFPVITGMVEKRSAHIEHSLVLAREAETRMENIAREQAKLIEETRLEQARILKEATLTRRRILAMARKDAEQETSKLLEKARIEIAAEKESALRDIRKEVAMLSVQIAKKLVRKELKDDDAQLQYIEKLVGEMSSNVENLRGN